MTDYWFDQRYADAYFAQYDANPGGPACDRCGNAPATWDSELCRSCRDGAPDGRARRRLDTQETP